MNMSKMLHVTNRDDWRAWLKENHDKEKQAWLIFYKKHTGKPRIPYDDAVEEALCFGWIDSIVKRIDDEKYAQKFTPRKADSKWSESNKKRVEKMIQAGRMTEPGLELINAAKRNGKWEQVISQPKELIIPPGIKDALSANKKAWENFNNLAPSYKRQYIGWITTAKKEETRQQRLKKAIDLLAQGKKLGLK
ncbi:MAG: YdeI/OmpD-associated family protein [Candidatus Aminicenantes bacterium]|nr:MAG: YdeI/OmpD-associated family protein [Candidatus Aminicenantes bacterium]